METVEEASFLMLVNMKLNFSLNDETTLKCFYIYSEIYLPPVHILNMKTIWDARSIVMIDGKLLKLKMI